jgi:hypothetical protein
MDAARQNWAQVEPSIFGTLFERCLNPDKRAQIGAHYTSRADILLVVEPVVAAPLRREWAEVRAAVERQLARRSRAKDPDTKSNADDAINHNLQGFDHRLAAVRILDPACGSGNFLYTAIRQVLELEREVIEFAARPEIGQTFLPRVHPRQVAGLELDPFAAELAQVVIWIGYLQWMHDYSFAIHRDPILDKFHNIECRDAILDLSNPKLPVPAEWPEADFIIGNPPFLGSKLFRHNGLPDEYIEAMYKAYALPGNSDLCCYWFARAQQELARHPSLRVGLLATQGIRGVDNRTVLEKIKQTGDIFMAWSDRDWVLDGANVHVSIIGFDSGIEKSRTLDGQTVAYINADLTAEEDAAKAKVLPENAGIYRRPPEKGAKFEMGHEQACEMLKAPNPNGRPNSEVLRPWINADALVKSRQAFWIVDFPPELSEALASQYERPFAHVLSNVHDFRMKNRDPRLRQLWWLYRRTGEGVRAAACVMPRFLCTPMVSKHRVFVWLPSTTQPDKTITVFARSDDYFFGVLHSSIHELWSRRMGTQLREVESGFRYTPTTCFETFPLPWPPGKEPAAPNADRIGEAARDLNDQRERWLNPPEWIDPIAQGIDSADSFADVPPEARPVIRQSFIMAAAAKDPRLKKRTLTNLYNERSTWLRLAHEKLDRAVLAAYAAADPQGGWSEDWAHVWKDTGAGQPLPAGHPLSARRAEIDQKVLANLLRLNLARA